MVQLREKDLPGGRLLELASSLKDAVGDSALLIINERVDVAVAGGVAGVQLGEESPDGGSRPPYPGAGASDWPVGALGGRSGPGYRRRG